MLLKERGGDIPELKITYNPNPLSKPIASSRDTVNILRRIWDINLLTIQEQVYVLFLNGNNQVICYRLLNTGTASNTLFDIKLAMACALGCLAGRVIIAHNHPSGKLMPSRGDIEITRQLSAACRLMDIKLLDHIIINQAEYYSFIDNDLMP